MKLCFLIARRPDGPSQIINDVCSVLAQRGISADTLIAEETLIQPDELIAKYDLFLLKSYTDLSLSLAGALHARGARLLNRFDACVTVRNKIIASQVLRAAGIPVPACWFTSDFGLLMPIVRHTPLIIKPYMGWRGEGIQVVRNERELAAVPPPPVPVIIQEYLEHSGEDVRLYVADGQVFATRKPFSATSFSVPGRQVPVPHELRELALSCGKAFGLSLYGVDILETNDGPRVVDVNYFPGYKGIATAAEAVADHIERYAACEGDRTRSAMGVA